MRSLRNAWRAVFADVILASCSVAWGVNISVSALILRHLQPVTFAVGSCGIAAVAFALITLMREGSLRIPRSEIVHVLLPGALTIVAFICYFYALRIVGAAPMALLFATMPLFVMLLASLAARRALPVINWIAALLGLAGVTMVILNGTAISFRHVLGDLEGLTAALCAAAYTVTLKPLSRRYSPFKLLAYVFGISAIGTAIFGYRQLAHQQWAQIPPSTWLEIVGSIVVAFIVGDSVYVIGVKQAGPVRAAMYSYLEPVFGVVSATILLAARLPALALAGGAVILVALIFGHGRPRQPLEAVTESNSAIRTDVQTDDTSCCLASRHFIALMIRSVGPFGSGRSPRPASPSCRG
jgi:drug/metabolite transporter (DMT)-like permease